MLDRLKEWFRSNAPLLSRLYQNKYVGMLYDHFASLPTSKQRQFLTGGVILFLGIVFGTLFTNYISVLNLKAKVSDISHMKEMLHRFQKEQQKKESQIQMLSGNAQLATTGAFKRYVLESTRVSGISPRHVEVEEKMTESESPEGGTESVQVKQANIKIQRVNLTQLKSFLEAIEFGKYNLNILKLVVQNDESLRGYMNVQLSAVAYIFSNRNSEEAFGES